MFGRMEPGSPEWGRALDAHLQPPDYDGCEDCECEDAEFPERPFVIAGPEDFEDGTLYWSNEDGWVDQASATKFTEAESKTLNLPLDPEARWERGDEPCDCKCHNIPFDPNEDGDDEPHDYNDREREDY